MFHVFPFLAGAVVGAGVVMLLNSSKTKESLKKGGELIEATKECISEKLTKKKEEKDEQGA